MYARDGCHRAVPVPDGVVTPGVLGCAEGDLAEAYYAAIVPTPGTPRSRPL